MQRTSNLEDEGGFTSFIRHVVPVHRSKMAVCGLCNVYEAGSGVVQDKLVSSTDLIKWNGHRKEILKLTFRAVVLLQLWQMANILESLYRDQFKLSSQLIILALKQLFAREVERRFVNFHFEHVLSMKGIFSVLNHVIWEFPCIQIVAALTIIGTVERTIDSQPNPSWAPKRFVISHSTFTFQAFLILLVRLSMKGHFFQCHVQEKYDRR